MVRYSIALMLTLWTSSAFAMPPSLYREVAYEVGIPSQALYALALTESATRLNDGSVKPWPWTLNVKGKGYYYANQKAACTALKQTLKRTSSVDVGLAQVNWYWHKQGFKSPCALLDPKTNLTYASGLLKKAFQNKKHWGKAAGAYHRPAGGPLAFRYQQRFELHLHSLVR